MIQEIPMTPMDWLDQAAADAARHGLPDARAVLDGLARLAGVLRAADWNEDASGTAESAPVPAPPAR
jgi:hypothetical protein